jgi:hypothetical protein
VVEGVTRGPNTLPFTKRGEVTGVRVDPSESLSDSKPFDCD